MKQLEVQIMGQSYLLGCPEGGEAQLQAAVERVDTAMCRIRDAGKVKARDRIAVLAALNLAFDLANRPSAATTPPAQATQENAASAADDKRVTNGGSDTASDAASDTASNTFSDKAAITALLHRLDTVLGEDGRLI